MGFGSQNLSENGENDDIKGENSFMASAWGNLKNAVIGCSAAVLFGIAVLMMSILSVTNPQSVFPQEAAGSAMGVEISEDEAEPVEYYLPYPGVLPDSPIYKIKALRDRIRLWLTFDAGEKIQRELLYADKRVNAAVALIEGGKPALGASTATKAEKYLESAVNRAITQQKLGQDVTSLLLTLEKATAKHALVIEELLTKTTGSDRDGLEKSLKLSKILQEKVAQSLQE